QRPGRPRRERGRPHSNSSIRSPPSPSPLRRHFHDAEYAHLYDRVAIARALFAITGDPEGLVAPLLSTTLWPSFASAAPTEAGHVPAPTP
ncbi:hypothetical protein, partial [Nonomuraea sp. NPDC001023]|uniref:hypothetical protein n=1 Tax=Nonomuraea sp. NPDC001023 TaxID=3154770 RepID=UPI00331D7104